MRIITLGVAFTCRIIYITPDGIKTQEYSPAECMYDYEEARGLYFNKQVKPGCTELILDWRRG